MKEIKKITYDSPLYKETLALRDRILRQPLGLQFTPAELEKDKYDTHFCLLVDGKVAACLILTETENRRMKMRQVAVDTPKQGTGLGRELSEAAEKYARDKGFNTMF